jgi:hypothetical protein
MDYEAFTNESLTMMYEGIRGALRADDALMRDARDPHSGSVELRSGRSTPQTLSSKCSDAECPSR